MRLVLVTLLVVLALYGALPGNALAEPVPIVGQVIYGPDDRIDVFEETNASRIEWANATCGLVRASDLQYDAQSDTYTLDTGAFTVSGRRACEDEPFGDQPTGPFCSGFAAGATTIVTAGHCINDQSLAGVRFVFGFQMLDADNAVTTLRGDQVYEGVEVLGRQNNGTFDYAVIRLASPITAPEVSFRRIRREGVVANGTRIGVIGHPSGLPLKLAFGDTTAVIDNSPTGYFTANLDTYGGNSGSPVFNAATGVVEGILVRGARDYDVFRNCFESNRLPDDSPGEDVSKTTSFAEYVPPLVLTVAHSADRDENGVIDLSELLRVVQLYNAGSYHCDTVKSEDGYLPGAGDKSCAPHDSDFMETDFSISLSELLRLVQFYGGSFYEPCESGEDGFCIVSR